MSRTGNAGHHVPGAVQAGAGGAAAAAPAQAASPAARHRDPLPAVVLLHGRRFLALPQVRCHGIDSNQGMTWGERAIAVVLFLLHCSIKAALIQHEIAREFQRQGDGLCGAGVRAVRRFVQKNLLVEVTSNARLARVFGWLLRRHTFASYSLYTAGCRRAPPAFPRALHSRAHVWPIFCRLSLTLRLTRRCPGKVRSAACAAVCQTTPMGGVRSSRRHHQLRAEPGAGILPVPVRAVRLDAHDPAGGVHSHQLLREQHLRRPHLVPAALRPRHHQRHQRLPHRCSTAPPTCIPLRSGRSRRALHHMRLPFGSSRCRRFLQMVAWRPHAGSAHV